MSLNLLRFEHQGRVSWGIVRGGRITPIPGDFPRTADLVRGAEVARWKELGGPFLAESEVRLLSPVTSDGQFICQGANYRQHMLESGVDPDLKAFNMIFTKAPSCIVAADSDVVRPSHVRFLDYEIELGLVLGADLTSKRVVAAADLHELIAGLVIVNDYSARDVQIPQMQFYKGKSFRTFGPVGPHLCLLEPQDYTRLGDLELTLTVNRDVRQRDQVGNMVYGPAETLAELSGVHDLHAGDLIATGTPAGCALSIPSPAKQRLAALLPEKKKWELFLKMQSKRKQYLEPGDVVESRIKTADGAIDLGVQRNRIVSEA